MAKGPTTGCRGVAGCVVLLAAVVVYVGGDTNRLTARPEVQADIFDGSEHNVVASGVGGRQAPPPLPRLKIRANSTSVSGFGYGVRACYTCSRVLTRLSALPATTVSGVASRRQGACMQPTDRFLRSHQAPCSSHALWPPCVRPPTHANRVIWLYKCTWRSPGRSRACVASQLNPFTVLSRSAA
jgi:hypothetical protein